MGRSIEGETDSDDIHHLPHRSPKRGGIIMGAVAQRPLLLNDNDETILIVGPPRSALALTPRRQQHFLRN
eukprot:6130876-Pyramimonas_sp.AAC.1